MPSKLSQENNLLSEHFFGEEVSKIRKDRKMTLEEFGKIIGYSRSYISQVESGQKNPSSRFMDSIKNKFLPGEHKAFEIHDPESYTYIPIFDVKAHAGGGSLIEEEKIIDSLAFKRSWINQELLANRDDLFLIHMEGESMEPSLHAKDILLVDRRDTRFSRESIYVIREGEMLLVKRVRQKGPGLVELISDNPSYPPREINLNTISENGFKIIGRVVWVGRRI